MTVRPDDDADFMTVAELIEKLRQFDPTLPVAIRDADTDWDLDLENIEVAEDKGGKFLYLQGSYY